jgi:hypothetical protein
MNAAKITFGVVFSVFFVVGFGFNLLQESYGYLVLCFFSMILCNYFVITTYRKMQAAKNAYKKKEPT